MKMKKIIGLLAAWLSFAGPAMAQTSTTYQLTDSAFAVHQIHSFTCLSSLVCQAIVPIDFTGSPFGVAGNPFYIAPGIGATFPVSGAVGVTAWGSATLGNATAVGTPPTGNIIGANVDLFGALNTGTDGIAGTAGNAQVGSFGYYTDPVSGTFIRVRGNLTGAFVNGFAPNGNYASLTATGSFAAVALPTGSTVAIQNTGTTTVSCTLGSSVFNPAVANQLQVPPSSSRPVLVGSNTFVACIDQTGSASNLVVLAGGTGLDQPFGGGGGGGGGGAIFGPTAVGSANANPPVIIGGTATGAAGQNVEGVAVKPASTASVATDLSLVTNESPNSQLSTGVAAISFGAYSTASITRVANTTTYTPNTGWNNGTPTFFSLTAVCRANGTQVLIPRIDIWSSANPTLKLAGTLYLFSAVPGTNISDNVTFTIASADFANLTGSFAGFPFSLVNSQASGAANSSTSLTGATYQAQCASGTTTITGMVEVTNAYVPASAEVLHVGIATTGVN